VRAVVSKRGVDDGNLKGGGSLQPAQESCFYYSKNVKFVKKNFKKNKNFFYLDVPSGNEPGVCPENKVAEVEISPEFRKN